MDFSAVFGFWDCMLVVVVALQATALAYVHSPRGKAFVMLLPIPFVFAVIAVGRPVDATNIAGLGLIYIYSCTVRLFTYQLRIPIILSILLAAFLYCLEGASLMRFVPATESAFWMSCGIAIVFALVMLRVDKPRMEMGHRTSLPLWIKLPAVTAIVVLLVTVKVLLQGFFTTAPMVALVGSYEARKSLYAVTTQMPLMILFVTTVSMISRLTYHAHGLGISLLLGWSVCLVVLGTSALWSGKRFALLARGYRDASR